MYIPSFSSFQVSPLKYERQHILGGRTDRQTPMWFSRVFIKNSRMRKRPLLKLGTYYLDVQRIYFWNLQPISSSGSWETSFQSVPVLKLHTEKPSRIKGGVLCAYLDDDAVPGQHEKGNCVTRQEVCCCIRTGRFHVITRGEPPLLSSNGYFNVWWA